MRSAFPNKFAVRAMRVLLALLALVGLLAWLLGTEAALQMGARQAERLSDGRLTLQAVSGSLYGPLRIEALSVQSEEQCFELKDVKLDWAPLQLLRQNIQLTRLSFGELRITAIKPSAEPARLPETLQLPVRFAAPVVTIERVVIVSAGKEHVLRGIDLAVEKSADSYTLSLRSITSAWGQGTAELLATAAKYLPESPPFFDADDITDRSERFLAAELVREKLFRLLGDELPYTTAVVIDEFKEEGALRRIQATIYVDDSNPTPPGDGTQGNPYATITQAVSRLAVENAGFNGCFTTEDAQEGLAAFLEKREANFKGR